MLKYGRLEFASPLILAPMADVTDRQFRLLLKRMGGIGLVTMEFVSSRDIELRHRRLAAILRYSPEERPISVQIYGSDPALMAEAARFVQDQGLPAPGGVPVIFRIEIEDMRAVLMPGIAMRRNGATGRPVVPMAVQGEAVASHHLGNELSVAAAAKLRHEVLPGPSHLQAIVVLKDITVMRPLTMASLYSEALFEEGDGREAFHQLPVVFVGEEPGGVDPWKWPGCLEGLRVKLAQAVVVQIGHRISISRSVDLAARGQRKVV